MLLILLANDIILVCVGFGVAQAYFAISSGHGHVSVNRALHVYQHNYTTRFWWLSRLVHALARLYCGFSLECHIHVLFGCLVLIAYYNAIKVDPLAQLLASLLTSDDSTLS